MSKYLGSVCCLHHRDSNPSMAIYSGEISHPYEYSYYCFGCHATGYLDEDEAMDLLDNTPPKQDHRLWKECLTIPLEIASKFLRERQVDTKWYSDYGIMSYGDKELYLPCYDYNRKNIGAQIRSLEDNASPKIWSIPDESGKYPTHSWIYNYGKAKSYATIDMWGESSDSKTICIVESILDGLSIWSRVGIPSIAVLGTNPTKEFYQTLTNLDKKYHRLYIVFDPDNAGLSSAIRLVQQLGNIGYKASIPLIEDKVYKIETKRLKEVLDV